MIYCNPNTEKVKYKWWSQSPNPSASSFLSEAKSETTHVPGKNILSRSMACRACCSEKETSRAFLEHLPLSKSVYSTHFFPWPAGHSTIPPVPISSPESQDLKQAVDLRNFQLCSTHSTEIRFPFTEYFSRTGGDISFSPHDPVGCIVPSIVPATRPSFGHMKRFVTCIKSQS